LLVDTIPGFICNQSKQIDGVILQSSHSSLNAVSACWIRFVSDHDPWTSKRLMLKFEYFDISDHSVQLTVRGTSSGYVCLIHLLLFWLFGFIINDISKSYLELFLFLLYQRRMMCCLADMLAIMNCDVS